LSVISNSIQQEAWAKVDLNPDLLDGILPVRHNPFIIFHTNKSVKVQSGYEGRVSLLEPGVSQNNCSIIINDLKQSDSGLYQIRVTGELDEKQNGFTFIPKVNVSKPKIKFPTLTEGQRATLTCTAPGLCSGSVPKITWTWRGAGGNESDITGNKTSFRTKNTTACTQRHTSILAFNALAKHHNSRITCKISFTGETTTEGNATLNVTCEYYLQCSVKLTGVTSVQEGESLNLTCSLESFPPSLVMWTKLNSDTNLHSDSGSASLFIQNVTAEHSGLYVCTAKHMNDTQKDNVTLTYANINFSLLNRNSARGARRRQESTKTEYAEIKKAVKEEQENDVGRGREISEGEEEKVVMELEMKRCEPQKDEGVEAVYSTVNDIMEEI
uniref:B-cell receptor CD22 n=1 Tax=Amphilophus citrinellus TaxID=61819 RepID=A0A3Q0QU55_AMPCI